MTSYIVMFSGCSLDCCFCTMGRGLPADKSSLHKAAKKILEAVNAGCKQIQLSGSDPLEYEHIVSMVKFIHKLDIKEIQIASHGAPLADVQFTKKLIEAGVTSFIIALHGSTPKIHDKITQALGSYKKTVEGLNNLNKLNIKFEVNALILKYNINDLKNIADLSDKYGATNFSVGPTYITKEPGEYYLPIKDFVPELGKLHDYSEKITYREIPYCAFKGTKKLKLQYIYNYEGHNKFLKDQLSGKAKHRNKVHTDICSCCKFKNKCDGFLAEDVKRFGTGKLECIQ